MLHNDKPGTGFKDAPRCFSLKLAKATKGLFKAQSLTHDDQLLVKHNLGQLIFSATIHVDDIKVACPAVVLTQFIKALTDIFGAGELDITPTTFTNCGMRHIHKSGGYTMDQVVYINSMKPITTTGMLGIKNTEPAPSYLAGLFLSLLMALAFTSLTRPDLSVYIASLQRVAQVPLMLHVRRLNALVRWAQRHPMTLTFGPMTCINVLEVHSDSGFKREEDETGHASGRSLHGANYLRLGAGKDDKNRICHLLEWSSKLLKQVTRSTFTSETLGVIASADNAIVIATLLHEIAHGPLQAREVARASERGGLTMKIHLVTDALNLLVNAL